MNKKRELFKSKKMKLVTVFILITMVVAVIISYSQYQSDKREQVVIAQQKIGNEKIEKKKQEELNNQAELKKLEKEKASKEQDALAKQKKIEGQKVLENEKKLAEQKKIDDEKAEKEDNNEKVINQNTELTKEKAIALVSKIIISDNQKIKVGYDHTQKRDGKNYYVLRAYDDMADHISTLAWYYVDVTTGEAFEWNLMEDTLVPIN
ncbi:hypothetical protein [Clostridium lacusfryxellense]|uniref:hypothetical protein n=1 Tax=Clostridium lacusfryxellense TaxID=205328 RepID=UPI001C0CA7EA|nr:hypothetical protein [Clostridium lacusfryxellense]MBU3111010.1 hypothetical protein [Clostridium lacusfryxellense]